MVDLDSLANWSSSFAAAQNDNVSDSVRHRMIEASPQLFEDALAKLFDLTPRDAVIAATLSWIRSTTVAAYHGSRLTDMEVASVRTEGLIPLKAGERRVRLEKALSCHARWPEVSGKLSSTITACARGREGRVTLAFSRSALTKGYNHYLTRGSEFDQCVAENLLGPEGIELLAIYGKKTLIQVAVPGTIALQSANPYRTIEEIVAKGEIPQLAKEFLEIWSYSLAHPEHRHFSRGCDMALESIVPAVWILNIETLND